MERCDTNGRDGQLVMEEMATGWSDLCVGALLAQVSVADHQAPPPSFRCHVTHEAYTQVCLLDRTRARTNRSGENTLTVMSTRCV